MEQCRCKTAFKCERNATETIYLVVLIADNASRTCSISGRPTVPRFCLRQRVEFLVECAKALWKKCFEISLSEAIFIDEIVQSVNNKRGFRVMC